jgi:hypothetical protein
LFKIFKKQTYSCIKTNDEWRHTYLLKSYGYLLSGGGRADGQGRRKGRARAMDTFYLVVAVLTVKEEEKVVLFTAERKAI